MEATARWLFHCLRAGVKTRKERRGSFMRKHSGNRLLFHSVEALIADNSIWSHGYVWLSGKQWLQHHCGAPTLSQILRSSATAFLVSRETCPASEHLALLQNLLLSYASRPGSRTLLFCPNNIRPRFGCRDLALAGDLVGMADVLGRSGRKREFWGSEIVDDTVS